MSDQQDLEITCYLKTYCGWSEGVRAIMRKYSLRYEEKDIIKNPAFRWEMEQKSGQPLSPCVVVNGEMLADVSGEEVEQFLLDKNLVAPTDQEADAPTDRSCTGTSGKTKRMNARRKSKDESFSYARSSLPKSAPRALLGKSSGCASRDRFLLLTNSGPPSRVHC